MCLPCNMTTVCFCRVCKEVKLCYSFGECRFEEHREGYFRETRRIQKTRGIRRHKTLSKKEKSLSWTTVWGCVPGKKDKCRKIAVTEKQS